jgi:hypothetical protein
MKKLTLILIFIAPLMRADSITIVGTSGWVAGSSNWLDGVSTSRSGGVIEFEAYSPIHGSLPGNTLFASGWLYANTGTVEFEGSFTHAFYNANTQTLTGRFSGFDYNYITNQYNWNITGVFKEKMSFTNSGGVMYGSGRGSLRPSTVPEPGTLGLLGTGLLVIAGQARKRVPGLLHS